MSSEIGRLRASRVRLYGTVRSAHLERAHQLSPAAIVYRARRYDFDESLTSGLELRQAGPWRAALLLRRSDISEIEVNEPLMVASLPATALALALTRLGRRERPRVVTYAIENDDPFRSSSPRLRGRGRRRLQRWLAAYVWRRLDAVAFGTEGARENYRLFFAQAGSPVETLIPALPSSTGRVAGDRRRAETVVFLGAFVERKGFPLLLEAWPQVLMARPDAQLRLIGKGDLADQARDFAAGWPESVHLIEDPPRPEIRSLLASSTVLVLASQVRPRWREQVGLPIVEGLEQGCSIVTTDQTGLAPWLSAHGHSVVPAKAGASELAAAIVEQLEAGDRSDQIRASLPLIDGRLAADEWLFRTL